MENQTGNVVENSSNGGTDATTAHIEFNSSGLENMQSESEQQHTLEQSSEQSHEQTQQATFEQQEQFLQQQREKEEEEEALHNSKKQIEKSLIKLTDVMNETNKLVTNVRVEGDTEENERRIRQELKMESIQQKLQNEAVTSAKSNAAVQMRWPALKERNIPQDLLEDLNQQKTACDKIIRSKDRLITELNSELRNKDEEYVKALLKQTKDIDLLIMRMREQIIQLVKEYELQLEKIEISFENERKELLKQNDKELEEHKQKRRDQEKKYIDDRKVRLEEFEEEIEQLRNQELERHAIAKKELNDQINALEQAIDKLRGEYHLHSEKLKYFYDGLQHRKEANENANKYNQRKINSLRNDLTGIKAKYARDDKKFKTANNEITEQYKRLSKQYKDLILKFKYFEEADTKKYRDIWKMNQEIVEDFANQLLRVDQLITEQQLGMKWVPPEEDFFKSPYDDGNFNDATTLDKSSVFQDADKKVEFGEVDGSRLPPSSQTTRVIMETLCDTAGFLVEKRVKKALERLDPDEAKLLKADAILRTLGIENPNEISKLMSYFAQIIEENQNVINEMQQSQDNQHSSIEVLSMDDVMEALRRFVDDQQKTMLRENTSIKKKKAKMLNAQERARERKRKEEKRFWSQMSQVIPDSKYRAWTALEEGLEKYGILLQEREELVDETEMIRLQNNELRALLEQYMNQKIHQELLIPFNHNMVNLLNK
jgi:dynein regulatory complex protein 1